MQYLPDRTTLETSHEAGLADYAILLAALDRLIAEGDQEIARLGEAKVVRLDDKLRVRPSPSLLADLKQLLGPGCAG